MNATTYGTSPAALKLVEILEEENKKGAAAKVQKHLQCLREDLCAIRNLYRYGPFRPTPQVIKRLIAAVKARYISGVDQIRLSDTVKSFLRNVVNGQVHAFIEREFK